MSKTRSRRQSVEIPLIGEVDDWEEDAVKSLLDIPEGGECVFYIDSSGGSVYGALTVATLMRRRRLRCTGIVLGECSSASLLVFAACQKRVVTRYSTMLFHRMRWQSDKRVDAREASLSARHFDEMEQEIDALQERLFGGSLEQVREWTRSGNYVSGAQVVAAGLAEMLEI